jgi:arylsulfatase A-like enzyme/Tfp pilus assembly protein PilF
MRQFFTLLILALLTFNGGCNRHKGEGTPTNVILIIVDTLRADHLSCYGYKDNKTPNIDRLAREGVLFETAVSHVPLTLPSFTSIFTSLTPWEHGVHYNEGFFVNDTLHTLAEVLAETGYATGGVAGAVIVHSAFGIDQGFSYYNDDFPDSFPMYKPSFQVLSSVFAKTQRRADSVTEEGLKWLRANKDKNFFLMLHYYDPHNPYDPPPQYSDVSQEGKKYEDFLELQIELYDGEILFTDEQIGRMLEGLRDLGLEDNTIVVFTADHGEGLQEKQENTHSIFIYDATVKVPLIIKSPGRLPKGERIREQVRIIDIFPTILDLLGEDIPDDISGESLVPFIIDGERADTRPTYIETYANRIERGWSILRGVRLEGWKYIEAPKPELYDLSEDPEEMVNLYDQEVERVSQLREILRSELERKYNQGSYVLPEFSMSEDLLEMVRSLGYVGLTGDEPLIDIFDSGVEGPDPKDMIEEFNNALYKYECQRIAFLFAQKGLWNEALLFLTKARSFDPKDSTLHLQIAGILKDLKQLDSADKEIDKVIFNDPDNAEAHYLKGVIAGRRGELKESLSSYRKVIALKPDHIMALNNMGMILAQRGELDSSLTILLKALEIDSTFGHIHANLGNHHHMVGDLEGALLEWEKALRLDDSLTHLHLTLGETYITDGEYAKAIDHYNAYIASNPHPFTASRLKGVISELEERLANYQKD